MVIVTNQFYRFLPPVLLAISLALFAHLTVAQAYPSVNYQGYLVDGAGLPITGSQAVSFRLYDAALGGNLVWADTQPATISDGRFSVRLGSAVNPLPAADDALWLGIEIAGGGEFVPRNAIDVVANVLRAGGTVAIAGQVEGNIQQLVSASCPAGESIRAIAADGSVTCDVDSNTVYSGSDFVTSGQSCSPGMVVTGVDASGNLVCSGAVASNTTTIATLSIDFDNHDTDTSNPHGVTAAQVGAASSASFSIHSASASAHHSPYTNADAVVGVKALDGAGSGISADLLDSLNSSVMLRSDASDTFTSGTFTLGSAATIALNGVVQIGADSSSDDDHLYFDDGVNQYLRWADSSNHFEISNDLNIAGALVVGPTNGAVFTHNVMRNSTVDVPVSGDISNTGDLYVGYDLELGGEIYANGKLFMNGSNAAGQDADQTIYFYNGDSRQGAYLRWNDFESRFDISPQVRIAGFVRADDDVVALGGLAVTGSTYIGFEYVVGAETPLNTNVACAGFGNCKTIDAYASCPAGKKILAGGCRCLNDSGSYQECYLTTNAKADSDTWKCEANTPLLAPGAASYKLTAAVTCGRIDL